MLKITSGQYRGRVLQTLPGENTRPTMERLRQAWLNSLQFLISEARILDLFSGTGALGFEALSRGAAFVTFVEENPKAVQVILKNAKDLGVLEQVRVYSKSVHSILPTLLNEGAFDFVFMDPPYEKEHEKKTIESWPWEKIVTPEGRICVEMAYSKNGSPPISSNLEIVRDERYGDSRLVFYRLKEGVQ